MKTLSIPDFQRRTAPLMDFDFALLDIAPDTRLGIFGPKRLSELITFCRLNPKYHIISFFKHTCIRVNALVEDAAFYKLGQGDNDPELMCIPPVSSNAALALRIREFEAG